MGILANTIKSIVKRPFIIVFIAILVLLGAGLNEINPLMPILKGLNSLTNESFFENIVSYLQLILDPELIPMIASITLIFCILASLLTGLLLSGLFNIVNKTILGKKSTKGDYKEGLKKYFKRIFPITLVSLVLTILFVLFMLVVLVPGIVVTIASITGKQELIIPALFVDILTIFVVFFGVMFFKAYIFFWFPAALNHEKKYFKAGKKIVDMNFWSIAIRLLAFDIVFIGFKYLNIYIREIPLFFIINWAFNTIFFTLLITYIFAVYKAYNKQNN